MHWLTKYTNKMTTLFNNHPYISSSKFSSNGHATTTYVGMVVAERCGHDMECVSLCAYHCVHGTSCLCTLSAMCIHPAIPTSARFIFRNLSMETCFCSFLIAIHTLYQHQSAISSAHVPAVCHCVGGNMQWRPAQQHMAYRSLEDTQRRLQIRLKLSTK